MARTSTAKKLSPAKVADPAPLVEHPHFVKLDAHCQPLPRDATNHAAVLDKRTNLIWSAACVKADNHAEAMELATAHAGVNGHDDWRAPTVEELFLLADRTKCDPAIDEEFFPNTPADWFWTSSPSAGDSSCAWGVSFGGGGADWGDRNGVGFVRAVRGPLAPAGQ
jgi:hypothetical protein